MREALGLIWSDLELGERPAINVTAQLSRDGERAPLKTKRSKRRVIITAELARELKAHKLASRYSGDDDFVFATNRGTGRNAHAFDAAAREDEKRAQLAALAM